jgi:hypothetical protein
MGEFRECPLGSVEGGFEGVRRGEGRREGEEVLLVVSQGRGEGCAPKKTVPM